MRVKLNPGSWEMIRGGGIEIEVLMTPLSFLDKIRASEMFAAEEHVIETVRDCDERGRIRERRVTRLVPGAQRMSTGMAFVVGKVVTAWRNVEDEGGVPIPFSVQALDSIMGQHSEWANELANRCRVIAGLEMAPADEGASDPQRASDSSPSNC